MSSSDGCFLRAPSAAGEPSIALPRSFLASPTVWRTLPYMSRTLTMSRTASARHARASSVPRGKAGANQCATSLRRSGLRRQRRAPEPRCHEQSHNGSADPVGRSSARAGHSHRRIVREWRDMQLGVRSRSVASAGNGGIAAGWPRRWRYVSLGLRLDFVLLRSPAAWPRASAVCPSRPCCAFWTACRWIGEWTLSVTRSCISSGWMCPS